MSDTKWTKGPWRVLIDSTSNNPQFYYPTVESDDYCIIGTEGLYGDIDVDIANANLISAAPDNYEANEWLLDAVKLLLEGKPVKDLNERILFSEKALAKARGESCDK